MNNMHQPGLTHFTVSETAERRIVNLHRNLDRYLGVDASAAD